MLIVKFISNTVGTWMSGIPSRMEFESGMEDEIVMNRKTIVYKIVSVIQPPFMQWNETLSKKLKSDFNINLRYYYYIYHNKLRFFYSLHILFSQID